MPAFLNAARRLTGYLFHVDNARPQILAALAAALLASGLGGILAVAATDYLPPEWRLGVAIGSGAVTVSALLLFFHLLFPRLAKTRLNTGPLAPVVRVGTGVWRHYFPPPPPTTYRAWSKHVAGGYRLYVEANPEDRLLPLPLVCQLVHLPGGVVTASEVIDEPESQRTAFAEFPGAFAVAVNDYGTYNFWWSTPGPSDDSNDPYDYSLTLADNFFTYDPPPMPSLRELRGF